MHESLRIRKNTIETRESKEALLNKYWRDPNFKIEINGEFLTLKEVYEKIIITSKEIHERTKMHFNEQIPEGKFILYVNQTFKGMMDSSELVHIDEDRLEKVRESETGSKEKNDNFAEDNIRYCFGATKEDKRLRVFNSCNPDEQIPDLTDCVGVVFSGGESYINGEENPERIAMLERSRNIINESKKIGIPKFGICLGAQLLASTEGMKIDNVKDENNTEKRITGADDITPIDQNDENSFLSDIKETLYIAQNHGQEIIEQEISNGKIIAKNERDGIEIIEFEDGTICIQGHPEVSSLRFDIGMILNGILKEPSYVFQNNLEKTKELFFNELIKRIGAYNSKKSNN